MQRLKQVYDELVNRVKRCEKDEAKEIVFLILQHELDIDKTDLLVSDTVHQSDDFSGYIERINRGEPLQYILGETRFLDRRFLVGPEVLIPRPETEELVLYAAEKKPKTILDLGTGSGCIAVSMALESPESHVYAIDLSNEALDLAKKNAKLNNARVDFKTGNILNFENPFAIKEFDMIVSNPPYVTYTEKNEMRKNVLDFEPHLALFVPDSDALVFYRKIAEIGKKHLASGGRIIVEINSGFNEPTADIFRKTGYREVKIINDFYGKPRIIEAKNLQ